MKKSITSCLLGVLFCACTSKPAQVTVLPPIENPKVTPTTDTPKKITRAESFFEGLDSLTIKVKQFDPSMGELEVMPSDSIFFEGKDKHNNRIWVSGANNGIGEIHWIWNHDGYQNPPANSLKNFGAIAKMMLGQKGKNWVMAELKKKATVEKQINDETTINYAHLEFHNDALTTIKLKIQLL